MAIGAPAASSSMSGSPPAKSPTPGASGAAATPSAPGGKQAPFGNSSATQPTPNAGFEAAAMQKVGVVIKQIQDIMQIVGAGSEPGKDLLKALNILVKLAPAGNVSNASERNMLEGALMRNTQNGAMQQQLKQQQQKPPGAAQGQPAPQAPPMGAAA